MNSLSLSPGQAFAQSFPTTGHSPLHHGQVHRGHHHDIPDTPAATTSSSGKVVPPNATSSSEGATQALSAADKLSSSLAGLNAAIAQLRAQLDALLGVNGSNPVSEPTPSATDVASSSGSTVSMLDMGAHFISKQRGELTITTQEGDVVTLKFSNKVSVDYAAHQASDGDTSVSMETMSVRSRSRIGVTVEGDLNDKELAAINNLVGKVGQLTDEFYNGNVDQALNAAGDLSFDTSQLSDMSLSLSLRQRFYAQGTAIVAAPVVPAPAPPISAPTPTVLPVVDPSVADQVAAAIDQAGSASQAASNPVDQPASNAADAATSAASTPAPAPSSESPSSPTTQTPAPTTQVLANFVAKVKENLKVSSTDSSLGFSYDFKVRLLLSAIVINAPAAPSTSSITAPTDPSPSNVTAA